MTNKQLYEFDVSSDFRFEETREGEISTDLLPLPLQLIIEEQKLPEYWRFIEGTDLARYGCPSRELRS